MLVISYDVCRLRQMLPRTVSACMSYSSMTCFDDELVKGVLEFYGLELDIATAEAEILDVECERVRFYPWLLWDWRSRPEAPTIGERFLREHQHSTIDRRLLEGLNTSYIGFYEALEDASVHGVRVRDIATGEILHIADDGLRDDLGRGQVLQARLVRLMSDGQEIVLVDTVYACLPEETIPTIEIEVQGLTDTQDGAPLSPERARAGLKRCASECLYFADQLLESLARPPAAFNSDGEGLLLCHSTISGQDAETVLATLRAGHSDYQAVDSRLWRWLPEGVHHGFVYHAKGDKVVLGANSVTRHTALEHEIAAITESRTPRLRSLSDFHDAVKRWTARGGGYPWLTGDPDVPGAVLEWLEFWARNWADLPSSALDGRTPREAVRNQQGRNRVERVLARFELLKLGHLTHASTRCVNRVRSELGLDPVG